MASSKICSLVLYKQHYRDEYREELPENLYSSLGYFDGFAIRTAEEMLSENLPTKQLAQMYLGSRTCMEQTNGSYGVQLIGLFSYEDYDVPKDFWQAWDHYVYMGIVIVKLKKLDSYKEVMKNCREIYNRHLNTVCVGMGSFDNVDMVIFIASNKLSDLDQNMQKIKEDKEIINSYTITGISQNYLNLCGNVICTKYDGKECYIEEVIKKVTLRIATKNNLGLQKLLLKWKQTQEVQTEGWEEFWNMMKTGRVSYCNAQHDFCLKFEDVPVKFLIRLLLKNGLLTHKNGLYGKYIYNIESDYSFCEKLVFSLEDDKITQNDSMDNGVKQDDIKDFFKYCLNKTKQEMKNLKDVKDRAYFQNLIMLLNTLAQFESFCLLKEIYCLIMPALKSFLKQFFDALDTYTKDILDEEKQQQYECKKRELVQLVECIDVMVEKIIHTDQMFLVVPGYHATTFWMPVKIQMFYQWLAYCLIDIFKENGHNYDVLLVPKMESKPYTREMLSKGQAGSDTTHTIIVQFGQKMLYDSSFFIILLHELSHYVGEKYRDRQFRKEKIIEDVAYVFVDSLFFNVEDVLHNEPQKIRLFFVEYREKVRQRLIQFFNKEAEHDTYASNLKESLRTAEWQVLNAGADDVIYANIFGKWEEWETTLEKQEKNIGIRIYDVFVEVEQVIEENRVCELFLGEVWNATEQIISLYKEIFSDVSAYVLLGFSFEEYTTAFAFSEEIEEMDDSLVAGEQCMRELAMKEIMSFNGKIHDAGLQYAEAGALGDRMYSFKNLQDNVCEYARECFRSLENARDKLNSAGYINMIAKAYDVFRNQSQIESIYQQVISAVDKYENDFRFS